MATPLERLLDAPFIVRPRPVPVPADLRPLRRICLLLAIVDQCQGQTASLSQLHVLDWAARTPASRMAFVESFRADRDPDVPTVRFDPSLDRAIAWAKADELVEPIVSQQKYSNSSDIKGVRLQLTVRGEELLRIVRSTETWLQDERRFLTTLGSVAQASVERYFRHEVLQ